MATPGNSARNRCNLHRCSYSPVFAPVGRFVASQERERVRIAAPEVWSVFGPLFGAPKAGQPAMDLSRDKNAEEMKWSPLEMGAAKQAHGA